MSELIFSFPFEITYVCIEMDISDIEGWKDFICGETDSYDVFDPDDDRERLYISRHNHYMWDYAEDLDISDVEYNGHFGSMVQFKTKPENVDKNVAIMSELVSIYLKEFDSNCKDDDSWNIAHYSAVDEVIDRIEELTNE